MFIFFKNCRTLHHIRTFFRAHKNHMQHCLGSNACSIDQPHLFLKSANHGNFIFPSCCSADSAHDANRWVNCARLIDENVWSQKSHVPSPIFFQGVPPEGNLSFLLHWYWHFWHSKRAWFWSYHLASNATNFGEILSSCWTQNVYP